MDSPIFIEVCSKLLLPLWQRRAQMIKTMFLDTNLSPLTDWSARSLRSWMLMSWAKGSDPGDVGEKHQLVPLKKQDIRWWIFFPLDSRFRIFQEVPASAAAVPGGGGVYGNWGFLAVDLCVGYRHGGSVWWRFWVVAQVPPRQLVPYFLWCL